MLMSFRSAALFLLVSFAIFVACSKGMPTPSFVNHEGGLLRVDNPHHQRFIVFAGEPSRETYLGGVPGTVTNFGMRIPLGQQLVNVARVEEYMLFRTNAAAIPIAWSTPAIIENAPHSLTIGEPPFSQLREGTGKVRFNNETDGFIEIRSYAWDGANIATLAPRSSSIRHLPCWDFRLYPVRLDWVSNDGGANFRETRLTNSAFLLAIYPDMLREITIRD